MTDYKDLCERLRQLDFGSTVEAADAIESLSASLKEAQEASLKHERIAFEVALKLTLTESQLARLCVLVASASLNGWRQEQQEEMTAMVNELLAAARTPKELTHG